MNLLPTIFSYRIFLMYLFKYILLFYFFLCISSFPHLSPSMGNRLQISFSLINDIKTEITELKKSYSELKQSQMRMEDNLTKKITALFDAREVQKDINIDIVRSLRRVEAKIDVLQMETAHLRNSS